MVLFSIVLFQMTEGGKEKFGIAIFGLLILIPLGALVSASCSIYKIRAMDKYTLPNWIPRSMFVLIPILFILLMFITISLMAMGSLLGFYGIVSVWLVFWGGGLIGYVLVHDTEN